MKTNKDGPKVKFIGWIKDAKYPDHSLGVSFAVGSSDHILSKGRELVNSERWSEYHIPPHTVTVTTYGKQTVVSRTVILRDVLREPFNGIIRDTDA